MNFAYPAELRAKQRALVAAGLILGPSLAGLVVGLCFLALGDRVGPLVEKNQLVPWARSLLVGGAVAGGALGLVAAFWSVFFRSADFGLRLAKLLSPLGLVALLAVFSQESLFRRRDLVFLIGVWITGALLSSAVAASILARPPSRLRWQFSRRTLRLAGLGLMVLSSLAYAVYFSRITIASHFNFCTSAFDLGIEDNLLWNAGHGGPLFRSAPLGGSMLHGGNHQTYFAYVLVPIYWLASRAETLLVIQSVALGLAAIPLYLFASRVLEPGLALLIALGYLFYAPLHGANLYDFHYQPFGILFTFLLAWLLLEGKSKLLPIVVLLMLSVREDMGAMMGALGGYFVLSGRRPREGFWIMLIGSAYFVAFKLWIMPQYFMGGESSFSYMYKDLVPAHEKGFGAVLKTVATNPVYVLDTLLTKEKLTYLLQIFVPVGVLALKRSPALVLFAPACTFTLLSTGYPALIMTSFQYTSYWTPMVFLAVTEVLSRPSPGPLRERRARQWGQALAIAATLLLTSNRYGAIFQTDTTRGAFDPVRVTITEEDRRNHDDFVALARQVPKNAKVVAAEWLVSHVSNRRDAYTLRFGILDAEYLLFWTHKEKLRSDEKPILKKALFGRDAAFGVVERRGMFVLAKRGYSKEKNNQLKGEL